MKQSVVRHLRTSCYERMMLLLCSFVCFFPCMICMLNFSCDSSFIVIKQFLFYQTSRQASRFLYHFVLYNPTRVSETCFAFTWNHPFNTNPFLESNYSHLPRTKPSCQTAGIWWWERHHPTLCSCHLGLSRPCELPSTKEGFVVGGSVPQLLVDMILYNPSPVIFVFWKICILKLL